MLNSGHLAVHRTTALAIVTGRHTPHLIVACGQPEPILLRIWFEVAHKRAVLTHCYVDWLTGLLEGGVTVQRAIVAAMLVDGTAKMELLDQARTWLVWHTDRFWAAALSEVRTPWWDGLLSMHKRECVVAK